MTLTLAAASHNHPRKTWLSPGGATGAQPYPGKKGEGYFFLLVRPLLAEARPVLVPPALLLAAGLVTRLPLLGLGARTALGGGVARGSATAAADRLLLAGPTPAPAPASSLLMGVGPQGGSCDCGNNPV